jgi:PII-like signaling protein
MNLSGQGKLLRIFVGESDKIHGHSLYSALVQKARELGLAGATVWRGIEGYGARSASTRPRSFASRRTCL